MRKLLNILIVDDEDIQIALLESYLTLKDKNVRVVATANNVDDAYKALINYKPDLVFLDIEMPDGNGFELAKLIKKNRISTKIVIVSAKTEYAYEAIKISVFDYIKKPYSPEDLYNILMKVDLEKYLFDENQQRAILMHDVFEKISFKVAQHDYFVKPSEIIFCESTKNSKAVLLKVTWLDDKILINFTLNALKQKLPKFLFYNIKASVLINITYISEIRRNKKICVLKSSDNELFEFKSNERRLIKLNKILQEVY